jgi:glutamine amidotransferase
MIGILKYSAGNLLSVQNALDRMGAEYLVSNDATELDTCERLIFPGVGHAKSCMDSLIENKLDAYLRTTKKPVLAICVGMQLLFDHSTEGDTKCLGIISGNVERFDEAKVGLVPHMGWNSVSFQHADASDGDYYFVHSYFCSPKDASVVWASSQYNEQKICTAVHSNNFYGTQFHPEKSGAIGAQLLYNYVHNKAPFLS